MGSPASAEGLLVARRIALRAGRDEIAPGAGAGARAAAAATRWNDDARLAGLPDELNPMMLDPARIEALLSALPSQSEEVLSRLEGRVLYLGSPGLHLDPASPYEPDAIAEGSSLTVPDEPPGSLVQPALTAPLTADRVAALARRARESTEASDREVTEIEPLVSAEGLEPEEKRRRLGALQNARARRFAAAVAWREAARALTAISAANDDEAREAREAATRYVSPSWIGMRG